eukprot:6626418-Lingulodinium_polyedra.AAC.1
MWPELRLRPARAIASAALRWRRRSKTTLSNDRTAAEAVSGEDLETPRSSVNARPGPTFQSI